MMGAIAGDIIGSVYEANPIKGTDFDLFSPLHTFTDDTVLTVAVAHAILSGENYADSLKHFARMFPQAGYGGLFKKWMLSDSKEGYGSYGTGSSMRVSPVGFAFDSLGEVLREAEAQSRVTHDHPEAIKAACAVAGGVFLLRNGSSKKELRLFVEESFSYDLDNTWEDARRGYGFSPKAVETVPEAMIAFLDSSGWEDAVRKAVALGGDSDTQAAIAGALAEAHYGAVPRRIKKEAENFLPESLNEVVKAFRVEFGRS